MKLKHLSFSCLLFFLLHIPIKAQNFTYFNKEINLESLRYFSKNSYVLNEENSRYATIGTFITAKANFIFLVKHDIKGNLKKAKMISTSEMTHQIPQGSLFHQNQGNFYLTYSRKGVNNPLQSNLALLKFKIDGDAVFEKDYPSNTKDSPSFLIPTDDATVLLGGTRGSGKNAAFLAMKVGHNGNEVWTKEYGNAAICNTAKSTLDKNYLLFGTIESAEKGKQMYLVKIDPLGKKLWEKQYGEEGDEEGLQITVLPRGGFLLTGTTTEEGKEKHVYKEVKNDGSLVWSKTYYKETLGKMETDVLPSIEGDGYIGVATIKNQDGYKQPLVLHITKEGTVDWTSSPTPDESTNVVVKDIDVTHNENGYLLTGYQPTSEVGWLSTIDFKGNYCKTLGCDSTAIVTDSEGSWVSPEIRIVPIPASKGHQVHYNLSSKNETATFNLYDLAGKKVKSATLQGGQKFHNIATDHLKTGAYLYNISYKGENIASGKLIVK